VIVATDDQSIANEVRRFGGESIMTPRSCPSGSDRVWLAAKNRKESVILNYQGDMPLLKASTLRATIKALSHNVDIATAVIPLRDSKRLKNPHVVKAVLAKDRRCLYFSRACVPYNRDGDQMIYWEHIGLYAYHRTALERFVQLPPSPLEKIEKLEQLRALEIGMSISAAVVADDPVSVDTPADLKRAHKMLKERTP
jgi:3-deoxy-manno-octulosonate cytidylyltransferase (CMP-KDO synthetase)